METRRQRIGLLGGTFDPIHFAHLRLAEDAREQLNLDRVLFLPAPNPWRKAGKTVVPVEHRLAMVMLAIADNPCFACSTLELDQDGPTFTANTLGALRAELGDDVVLHFIMGADALADLPHWHDPGRIVSLARLAVARRPRSRLPPLEALEQRVPGIRAVIDTVQMAPIDLSSTELRARAAAGRSLRYLMPDAVADYIQQHALYAKEPGAGRKRR
jgi:nicotinate-nucleotide adenylyltransferase